MRISLLVLILVLLSEVVAVSQTSMKGYKRYLENEYDKAGEYYREALLENDTDIVANYGMSLLYSNNTFKGYDYFKAFRYIRIASNGIRGANDRIILELGKNIPEIKDKISKDYTDIEDKLFNMIKTSSSIPDAEKFLAEFPDSKYMHDVVQIRNQEVFNVVKKTDSVVSYNRFIERFPKADELQEAIRLRNYTAYQDLIKIPDKTEKLFKTYDYLNRYPESAQTEKVILLRDSLEFEKAKEINTAESYTAYITHFPNSRMVDKAIAANIQKSYEKAQKRNTRKDFQEFINRYLTANQGEGALTLRDNLEFEEIQQTNTVDAYNSYITWASNSSPQKKKAISMRDKKAYSDAMETNTIESLEDFIQKYPTAIQVPEAIVLRDTLVLRQCRYLTSPMLFYEYMKPYPHLARSEKALLIIEQLTFKEAELSPDPKEGYIDFINKYPKSPLRKVAEERLSKIKQ